MAPFDSNEQKCEFYLLQAEGCEERAKKLEDAGRPDDAHRVATNGRDFARLAKRAMGLELSPEEQREEDELCTTFRESEEE